ncbi:hypothetical protein CPAR01_06375, partial [Colletotrichum paranaense]
EPKSFPWITRSYGRKGIIIEILLVYPCSPHNDTYNPSHVLGLPPSWLHIHLLSTPPLQHVVRPSSFFSSHQSSPGFISKPTSLYIPWLVSKRQLALTGLVRVLAEYRPNTSWPAFLLDKRTTISQLIPRPPPRTGVTPHGRPLLGFPSRLFVRFPSSRSRAPGTASLPP